MVRSFKPKSEFLARYIRDFSTFEKGCDLRINFATFPHVGPGLAWFKNARLEIGKQHLNIIPTHGEHYNTVVLGKYTSPVFITYNGYVDEVSINFTPLGINYFFDDPYCKIAPDNFQYLSDPGWINFAPRLFSTGNTDEQLELLEEFLRKRFRELPLEKLQHSIDLLMDIETDWKVSEAAETAGIHAKTLRRNFHQYLGCSPVLFKRIVRFRKAINVKRNKPAQYSLTQLSQEGLFYDSSHFGREYKLLSGQNPKSFFDSVSFLGNSDYPYIFL
jgi:AraC-like DNA-binding protein